MIFTDWSVKRGIKILCPGQAGVDGNERADELAGVAVVGGTVTLD